MLGRDGCVFFLLEGEEGDVGLKSYGLGFRVYSSSSLVFFLFKSFCFFSLPEGNGVHAGSHGDCIHPDKHA